jgi:hypothetical protein
MTPACATVRLKPPPGIERVVEGRHRDASLLNRPAEQFARIGLAMHVPVDPTLPAAIRHAGAALPATWMLESPFVEQSLNFRAYASWIGYRPIPR